MSYAAPVDDILHALTRIADIGTVIATRHFADLDAELVPAILGEAGRFAGERIAPLGPVGDRHPARLGDGAVATPPGWRETYADWCAAGWNGLAGPVDHGGQGLPVMLLMAVQEMWNAGSVAFALGPTLTTGAVEALVAHGAPDLVSRYLARLVSGEWMGTMNLTEPQAGSDVGALTTRAERSGDGSYRLFGTKIFITYGEHDLTDNIIHLVLARLPDGPAGSRGISLFLVPKILPDGTRNDVVCTGLEHKLGIHGSPTCTLVYGDRGGAVGWLIGTENRGLAAMFTMMNNARLAVGVQGVGIAEAATQQAVAFARERRQGRAPGWTAAGMSPIIEHPDVARMLLTGRALTTAARALCLLTAQAIDMSYACAGDDARRWSERAGLLTPLAKAFSTDIGSEVASLAVQVHGGMGYIEETGVARYLRDARITQIYEGTNGVQAIDLVSRKLPLSGGEAIAGVLAECAAIARDPAVAPVGSAMAARLAGHVAAAETATHWVMAPDRIEAEMLAVATPYLRLLALTVASCHVARGAAAAALAGDSDAPRHGAVARFLVEHLGDEITGLALRVTGGAPIVAAARVGLN